MSLLLGAGVVALLVIGIGRWVRPNRQKPPVDSATSAQPAQTIDGGAMVAAPETVVGGEAVAASADLVPHGAQPRADDAWAEAQRLRGLLLTRQVPPTMAVWEVVPEAGEVFFYDLQAEYERYYGQDVGYRPAAGFFFGSPAFLLAGLAVNGIANSSRRRAAEAQSMMQWREAERIRVVVTNHRLLCLVRGQWVSFHYGAMTAVYPEVSARALICEFGGIPPLRLLGPDVPIAAIMTVFATHGLQAVAEHPSLQVLGTA